MTDLPKDPSVGVAGAEVTLMFFYDDGDMATVTVSGFEKGFTAMRALVQSADETVLRGLFEEFSSVGDVSMLQVFDPLDYDQEESDND